MSAGAAIKLAKFAFDIWETGKNFSLQNKIAEASAAAQQAQNASAKSAFMLNVAEQQRDQTIDFGQRLANLNNRSSGGSPQERVALASAASELTEGQRRVRRQANITALNFKAASFQIRAEKFAKRGAIAAEYTKKLRDAVSDFVSTDNKDGSSDAAKGFDAFKSSSGGGGNPANAGYGHYSGSAGSVSTGP